VSVGVAAGEQPAGGDVVDGAVMASSRQTAQERGEWFVNLQRVGAQAKPHLVVVADDVIGGEGDDPGQGLGVEHDQRAGDPVGGVEGVVVDEASGEVPTVFGVDRWGGLALAGAGKVQVGGQVAVAMCPGEEGAPGPADGSRAGEPAVEVVLAAVTQVSARVLEASEEGGDLLDLAAGVADRDGRLAAGRGEAPQPRQRLPADPLLGQGAVVGVEVGE